MAYRFVPCHPLSRVQLAPPIPFASVEWTEVLGGNGTFQGKLAAPRNDDVLTRLISAVAPDDSALYIYNSDLNSYVWGGVVNKFGWSPETNEITAWASEWRSWLYSVFLGPKVDLSGDNTYSWTAADQLLIARQILGYATSGGATDGRPDIAVGEEASAKLRQLNVKGLDFKTAGELLDSMARRDGGFDWDLIIDTDPSDFLPTLRLGLYYPEKGGLIPGLLFRRTASGGNMILKSALERSTENRRTRVWTTGTTETMPFAVDSAPELADGYTLLREKVTNYSTVTERTTLAAHARAERKFLSSLVGLVEVEVDINNPPAHTYSVGDRCRVQYVDRVMSIDVSEARIIARKMEPFRDNGKATLLIDLVDDKAPEVDAGGVV